MKWKNRLTNYNFWISIISAVLLILQAFKINFDIAYINEIATAVLGLLVVIGIISDPTRSVSSPANEQTQTSAPETINHAVTPTDNIPNKEQDEADYVDLQNDFKALIAQISHDINAITQKNIDILDELKIKTLSTDEDKESIGKETLQTSIKENCTSYNIVNQ